MATSPEIVDRLASADDRDRVTIETCVRRLREGGLISRSGRPRVAAQMTAGDLATILIGCHASDTALDAPGAVERYRAFNAWRSDGAFAGVGPLPEKASAADIFQHLVDLVREQMEPALERRTLGAAIETLIEASPRILAAIYRGAYFLYEDQAGKFTLGPLAWAWVEVSFTRAGVENGAIRLYVSAPGGLEPELAPGPHLVAETRFNRLTAGAASPPRSDRKVTTTIGLRTLLQLGLGLASDHAVSNNSAAAALSSVRGEQRRETVQAATSSGDGDDA
jgi:hypothetical protein